MLFMTNNQEGVGPPSISHAVKKVFPASVICAG